MDKLLVILSATALICLIFWWFFGKKVIKKTEATVRDNEQVVEVEVSGGYSPDVVVLKSGIPAKIVFNRKDPSGCFNEVVFPDFGIHETLPVGQPHEVTIDPVKAGEYQYSCGMNMFHGKIVIE